MIIDYILFFCGNVLLHPFSVMLPPHGSFKMFPSQHTESAYYRYTESAYYRDTEAAYYRDTESAYNRDTESADYRDTESA